MSTYNEVPYPSGPIRPAHPDRLAGLAAICGLSPAPVETCRVLELGCSDGGNLIPLAELLPQAQFLGIDNSARQIDDGSAVIRQIGLENIRLVCADLLDETLELGEFNHIICHGVFSWVPGSVQDRILQICGRHLAPHGVAFISYNTYPGWHLRGMVRSMMLQHVAEFGDPQSKIDQAQAFLDFLVRFGPDADRPYARILKDEMDRLKQRPRTYLFHEHLESCNTPLYFNEFMQRAQGAGLAYLGDDMLPSSWRGRAHPDAARLMRDLDSDILRREQYLDYLQGTQFRQTLLCRAAAPVNYSPHSDAVRGRFLSTDLQPRSPVITMGSSEPVEFHTPDDRSVVLADPIAKSAVLHLARRWPRSVRYESLLSQAISQLTAEGAPRSDAARDDALLADAMLQCVAAGLVHLNLTPSRCAAGVSPRPRTTAFNRLRAAAVAPLTTLTHYQTSAAEIHRLLITQLDGRHDVPALVAWLVEQINEGAIRMETDGGSNVDLAQRDAALTSVVIESLDHFARTGLLID